VSSDSIRYRVRRECRGEHVLPLPATVPDADALLNAARVALHTDGRSTSEARLDARDGALVVSYAIDTDQTETGAEQRRKLGFT